MTDLSHLIALKTGLAHEQARLAAAKKKGEREIRAVWVAGYEKEIASELKFLGLDSDPTATEVDPAIAAMSDDDLLAELGV